MEIKRKSGEGGRQIALYFLSFLFIAQIGCSTHPKFDGEWEIIYIKDNNYSPLRHPIDNMIIIRMDAKISGGFPNTVGSQMSVSDLVDISIFRHENKNFVYFKLNDPNELFRDTFEIVYLKKDSFLIKSDIIELKCNRFSK